jgi:hypothetical protein
MAKVKYMFTIPCDRRCDESLGFPADLRPVVCDIAASLASTEIHPPSGVFQVNLDHEPLQIPYRVYYSQYRLRWKLRTSVSIERLVVACLGTRHYDGYLRQQSLQQLLRSDASWALPYIVQLAGEYVVEIADDVAAAIVDCDTASVANFAMQNPAYLATFNRRVTSYWNEYYRDSYPRREDYPGSKVVAHLFRVLR